MTTYILFNSVQMQNCNNLQGNLHRNNFELFVKVQHVSANTHFQRADRVHLGQLPDLWLHLDVQPLSE